MGPYVPPGQSPPFQVVDDLHHGAWVIITVALGLVLSIVSLLIRLYVRLALNPPLGKDDYVLLGATIVAIIQTSLLFAACSEGLGTSIDLLEEREVNRVQVLIVTSDILYLLTLFTTKCCVIGIYLRLTPQKLHNRASWATLALCTLWVIPAIFIIAVNCGLNRPWKGTGGQCENLVRPPTPNIRDGKEGSWLMISLPPIQLARWQFIVALDIATELILFGLAVVLLAGLFMSMKRKMTIAFAFIFRLPMIAFAVLHIYCLQRDIDSRDPTLKAVPSIIWAQVELNYALIACSVFCLQPFITAVSTNYGTAGDSTLEESSRNASRSKSAVSKSGEASASGGAMRVGNKTVTSGFGGLGGDISTYTGGGKGMKTHERKVVVQSPATDEIELMEQRSRGGDGSAKMIIRKDVQYTVEYDGVESPGAGLHNKGEYWD
ncbi:hypothetical protein BJX76DRAFT_353325 [Aspergillus varians]